MIPIWKLIPRVAGCLTKRNLATARVIIAETDKSEIAGQRSTEAYGDSGIVDPTFKALAASLQHDIYGLSLKGKRENYTDLTIQQEPYVIKQDDSELDPHIPLYDKCRVGMASFMESNVPYPAGPFDATTSYSYYSMSGAGRRRVNKYLYAAVHATHPSRQFSTSAPSKSQGGQTLAFMDVSDPTPQGIQGDQCVSFKLWLENCVRYGLPSCDEQLHAINSGRKTLAQVFAEQQELIKQVAEKYRRGDVKAKAAANGMLKSTISEHSPCPQGIQGDDCVRYKLWLENCRRFEFGDCEENIRAIQSGRKTLSQVFEEQDRQIQEIVHQYQQRRHYSTEARDDKVRDVVSDKYRGVMRMQFWKDALDNIFKGNPPHAPVALELAKVIEKHKLNKIWFTRLMEARAEQLEADGFRSVKAVEDYGENTVSALLYLLLQCAGVKNIHADHVASHLGRAQGVVTLLRATPYHSSKERVYLPVELLIKHGVSEESVIRGQQEKPLKDLVFDLASVAHHHLLTARNMKKDVPKEAIPIFLNSLICDQYLKKLQLADFSIFDKSLQKKNGLLPWQLFIQKMKRTY